jgi:hypothetical protein
LQYPGSQALFPLLQKLEYFQVVKNKQYDSEHNNNNATMPQETAHKMKDMYDDVKKITNDDEN